MQAWSLGQADPLGEGMAPIPVSLPGESHGLRRLEDCGPQGPEESDTAEATQHACMNPNAHHCPRRRADTQQAFLEWVL